MVRLFDDFYRFVRIDPVDARRDDRVAGQQPALDGDHVAADRLAEFDPVQPGAAFAVYRPDVVAVVAFEYGGQRYGRQTGAVGLFTRRLIMHDMPGAMSYFFRFSPSSVNVTEMPVACVEVCTYSFSRAPNVTPG